MKTTYLLIIKEFCVEFDYTLHEDYSGRGMYGKTCIGISGDVDPGVTIVDLISFSFDYFDDVENTRGFVEFLKHHNRDSMGRGAIVYFPGLKGTE